MNPQNQNFQFGWIIIASVIAFSSGCRPVPKSNLAFEVSALHAYDGSAVPDIGITLESRIVSDGVFNGNYELLSEGSTDASGTIVLDFPRSNALDYRITGNEDDWFERQMLVNPDAFLGDETQSIVLEMTPSAEITIRLVNSNPFDEMDAIQFRTLNVPGDYLTCSNAWGSYSGFDAVEERTCWIEADRFLAFTYRTMRNGEWFEFVVDSIYVPRGSELDFSLPW
jgi:hypothetical protein